jgi:hypothetical protein
MNPIITGALITGSSTILAALLTFLLTRVYDSRSLKILSKERRNTLNGLWQGKVTQEMGSRGFVDYPVTFEIKAQRKSVISKSTIIYHDDPYNQAVIFEMQGGFLHNRFLKLDYNSSSNRGAVHFGTTIHELSADGKQLNGRFVGFGLETQSLVAGTINLRKVT